MLVLLKVVVDLRVLEVMRAGWGFQRRVLRDEVQVIVPLGPWVMV